MRVLISILFVFFLGCEEESLCIPIKVDQLILNIDKDCSPREEGAIYGAINRLNALSKKLICSSIIRKGFFIEVDHSDIDSPNNTIVCYNEEPDWYEGSKYEGYLGWAAKDQYIKLFIFIKPDFSNNYSLALVLHELFHYIGIMKHVNNKEAVMYENIGPLNTDYTEMDEELFIEYFI